MLDKSIDGALLALRKQIIRGKLDGLEHVEVLLAMRGVHMPAVLPAKNANVALRGHARALICEALRDGPKTRREIVAYVVTKRPELPYDVVYRRVDRLLWRMGKAGALVNKGGVWKLAK
jgi:hypothetical protein